MSQLSVFWFLPTHGDGRFLNASLGERDITFAYLRQVAQAADQLGYEGVLLPTGLLAKNGIPQGMDKLVQGIIKAANSAG